MERVLVASNDVSWREALAADLAAAGHRAQAIPLDALDTDPERRTPQTALVVDLRTQTAFGAWADRARRAAGKGKAHVFAVLTPSQLAQMDLAAGFDDFLVEPFDGAQVVARARQLRWRQNRTDAADLLKASDLSINLASCEVTLQGVMLPLTYQEYELLRHLVKHRGRVFTREQLLSELWGYNYYGGTRTVDVHVRRLRGKLGPEHEDLIQTVRNVGYRFARDG